MLFLLLKVFQSPALGFEVSPIAVFAFVYVLGYMGISQSPILNENKLKPESRKQPGRYRKSGLTSEIAERYINTLLRHMENEKPYLDPELTLANLAEQLAIQPNHLSQIINDKLDQTFYRFVNQYRVNEAKRLLVDPDKKHLNILEIAYEAGFNSKSAFNSVFRQDTNMVPSRFRLRNMPHAQD